MSVINKKYECYYENEITKDLLDSIKINDLIEINDWKTPLRVKGVSENYIIMNRPMFGKYLYSVCEKKLMNNGYFYCGTDNLIFGSPYGYSFDKEDDINGYLQCFENGKIELSYRNNSNIEKIYIKRA